MSKTWLVTTVCIGFSIALLTEIGVAAAQDDPEGEVGPAESELLGEDLEQSTSDAVGRVLTTAAEDVPARFIIWQSDLEDTFIKPIVQISSLLVTYVPHSERTDELANRTSTLILSRLGFEGQLFGFVTFRSVFERNMGFVLARNGPLGTSVWEGTASIQARENYIRLSQWGLSLTGGIFPDPASVDYISSNILDAFGMDPYIRDPLLVGGFNQGQGLMLRYNWRWLTAGFAFTAGNPLTSSLSYGFGGDVSGLGTLFSAPLRAFTNGIPGSDIQMTVFSPSLTFESEYFDIKTVFQYYLVDTDITGDDDKPLDGWNIRGTAQVKLLDNQLRFFASGAFRRNQQLNVPDITEYKDDFTGLYLGGGADFNYGRFGIGGNYYWYRSILADAEDGGIGEDTNAITYKFINVGMTYWLWESNLSVGFRYARTMANSNLTELRVDSTDSYIFSLRLLI